MQRILNIEASDLRWMLGSPHNGDASPSTAPDPNRRYDTHNISLGAIRYLFRMVYQQRLDPRGWYASFVFGNWQATERTDHPGFARAPAESRLDDLPALLLVLSGERVDWSYGDGLVALGLNYPAYTLAVGNPDKGTIRVLDIGEPVDDARYCMVYEDVSGPEYHPTHGVWELDRAGINAVLRALRVSDAPA